MNIEQLRTLIFDDKEITKKGQQAHLVDLENSKKKLYLILKFVDFNAFNFNFLLDNHWSKEDFAVDWGTTRLLQQQ